MPMFEGFEMPQSQIDEILYLRRLERENLALYGSFGLNLIQKLHISGSDYLDFVDAINEGHSSIKISSAFPFSILKPKEPPPVEPEVPLPPIPPAPTPPPPPPPPIVVESFNTSTAFVPFDTLNFQQSLQDGLTTTFYYEPETLVVATGPNIECAEVSESSIEVMARTGGRPFKTGNVETNYHLITDLPNWSTYWTGEHSKLTTVNNLTVTMSPLNIKVKFTIFKDVSVSRSTTENALGYQLTDTVDAVTTKTLYPYSIYLKSVSIVPDSNGRNGYSSVSLLNSSVISNRIYSVDIEGAPTNCDSGYTLDMQQVLNDAYYPNMKLKFNFIDYAGNEFSFIHDDPLVEVDLGGASKVRVPYDLFIVNEWVHDYPRPFFEKYPRSSYLDPTGGVILRVPKLIGVTDSGTNYLTSLSYCAGISTPDEDWNRVYGYDFIFKTVYN